MANEIVASLDQLISQEEADRVPLTRYIANYGIKATIHALYANAMNDDSIEELAYLTDVDEVVIICYCNTLCTEQTLRTLISGFKIPAKGDRIRHELMYMMYLSCRQYILIWWSFLM